MNTDDVSKVAKQIYKGYFDRLVVLSWLHDIHSLGMDLAEMIEEDVIRLIELGWPEALSEKFEGAHREKFRNELRKKVTTDPEYNKKLISELVARFEKENGK